MKGEVLPTKQVSVNYGVLVYETGMIPGHRTVLEEKFTPYGHSVSSVSKQGPEVTSCDVEWITRTLLVLRCKKRWCSKPRRRSLSDFTSRRTGHLYDVSAEIKTRNEV